MNKNYPHIIFYCQTLNKIIFSLIISIFCLSKGYTQQFNNWYFPNYSGINFNVSPPSVLLNGQAIAGSSATISDETGNLLFYSDGDKVFNKLHQVMTNGDNLNGYGNQSGGLVIIPFLDNSKKYFLINSDGLTYSGGLEGYTYSIIDMNLQSGLVLLQGKISDSEIIRLQKKYQL